MALAFRCIESVVVEYFAHVGSYKKEAIVYSSFEAVGIVTALAMESEYSSWSLAEVKEYIMPALISGQFKIYVEGDDKPFAFVSWALVDDECHKILLESGQNPPSDRWSSGCNLWFIDVVAPFGGVLHIIRDMQRSQFSKYGRAHSIKRKPDGSVHRVKVWRNALVQRQQG